MCFDVPEEFFYSLDSNGDIVHTGIVVTLEAQQLSAPIHYCVSRWPPFRRNSQGLSRGTIDRKQTHYFPMSDNYLPLSGNAD